MQNSTIYIILIIGLALFLYYIYRKNFKILHTPNVCLTTGGVKCGKSLLTTYMSIKKYKSIHRKWWFQYHILGRQIEEPLYYTNVSISFGDLRKAKRHKLDKNIVNIDTTHLLRDVRFNYNSVIYIQEASLMADNMDFNNKERNIDLSLFAKLIGHETKGGYLFLDTQSVLDVHYSFKRVSSTYYFIQKNVNFSLFHILYVREMINTENGVNNFEDDLDTTTRKVLIPFWYHNKYNRYEYSYLTDNLDTNNNLHYVKKLVSFNPMYIKRAIKQKKEVTSNEKEKEDK